MATSVLKVITETKIFNWKKIWRQEVECSSDLTHLQASAESVVNASISWFEWFQLSCDWQVTAASTKCNFIETKRVSPVIWKRNPLLVVFNNVEMVETVDSGDEVMARLCKNMSISIVVSRYKQEILRMMSPVMISWW